MHMRLNKAKLWTCGVKTRTLLNLAKGFMMVVTGDSFLCRVRQFHVRGREGNSSNNSGDLGRNCRPTTSLKVSKQQCHCPS